MTKEQAPIFSLGAQGSIGKTLSFSETRKQHKASKFPEPQRSTTYEQFLQRQLYLMGILWWLAQSDATKKTFGESGSRKHRTAYQEGMSYYLKHKPDLWMWLPLDCGEAAAPRDIGPYNLTGGQVNTVTLPAISGNGTYYDGNFAHSWINLGNHGVDLTYFGVIMNIFPYDYGTANLGNILTIADGVNLNYHGWADGRIRASGDAIAGGWDFTTIPGAVPAGEWTRLAFVSWNGLLMVLNGLTIMGALGATYPLIDQTSVLRIGSPIVGLKQFHGIVDNLRIIVGRMTTEEDAIRFYASDHYP